MTGQGEYFLEMRNISKSFSGVKVLHNVSFQVKKGEIHGLLGGNGAGKSTLMNILGGLVSKDTGEIMIDGKRVVTKSPMDAKKLGISFIHQELMLFPLRSVGENIMISQLPVSGRLEFINDYEKNRIARECLELVGLDIDPRTKLEKLSIAEQQLVEIAKALSGKTKILILDEPTSSLTDKETQKLFEVIVSLKEKGVSIIFISHKLEEIFTICDRVSVLRDGKNVGTVDVKMTTKDELIKLLVGRQLKQLFPELPEPQKKEIILSVRNLQNTKLQNINFQLLKGEILGIFGLVGAGRSELARAVFGLDPVRSGKIEICGEILNGHSPAKAIEAGIAFLTENRRTEGLILEMGIRENISLPILPQISGFFGKIDKEKERDVANWALEKFNIVTSSLEQKVKNLSGGNQQKVVLSKWLSTKAKVIILDEPTRGVDVGAKAEIYEFITEMVRDNGLSVILISSEAPEILGMCHRILVMKDGALTGEFPRAEATQEKLLSYAMGGE